MNKNVPTEHRWGRIFSLQGRNISAKPNLIARPGTNKLFQRKCSYVKSIAAEHVVVAVDIHTAHVG